MHDLFLIDADVLSEATKQSPQKRAIDWIRRHERNLAVNPIIIGELQYGILALPGGRRRSALQEWFNGAIGLMHVFDIDDQTARVWAALLAKLKSAGKAMPVKDSLIAATALQHGLTIATRNAIDFRHSGAKIVNPFSR